jgi:hypothetical protein
MFIILYIIYVRIRNVSFVDNFVVIIECCDTSFLIIDLVIENFISFKFHLYNTVVKLKELKTKSSRNITF